MVLDYMEGKIYMIKSAQTDKIYIGSTVKSLVQRLSGHKSDYKAYLEDNTNKYVTSFEILQYADHYIELYELCPRSCKAELFEREGDVIKEFIDIACNKVIAGRTDAQYQMDNVDKIQESRKQYQIDNVDKINESARIYRDANNELLVAKRLAIWARRTCPEHYATWTNKQIVDFYIANPPIINKY